MEKASPDPEQVLLERPQVLLAKAKGMNPDFRPQDWFDKARDRAGSF